MELRATRVVFFWTAGCSLLSRFIRRVIGEWSHMGIMFEMSNGEFIYFEALFSDGFVGPKEYQKLLNWQNFDTRRRVHIEMTSIMGPRAEELRQQCERLVGRIGYAKWQLGAIWFYERIGKHFRIGIRKSPDKVVCSEVITRLVEKDIDLTDEYHWWPDMVTPSSAFNKFMRRKQSLSQTQRVEII